METLPLICIKQRHILVGRGYWFDPGTTRFFRSRYPRWAYRVGSQAFFVTSEQYDDGFPRLYTIRVMNWITGDVDTVGEFQAYGSRLEAIGS